MVGRQESPARCDLTATTLAATTQPTRVSRTILSGNSGSRPVTLSRDSSIVYDASQHRFVNGNASTKVAANEAKSSAGTAASSGEENECCRRWCGPTHGPIRAYGCAWQCGHAGASAHQSSIAACVGLLVHTRPAAAAWSGYFGRFQSMSTTVQAPSHRRSVAPAVIPRAEDITK